MWRLNKEHFESFLHSAPGDVGPAGHAPRRWAGLVSGEGLERLSYRALSHDDLAKLAAPNSGSSDRDVLLSVLAWSGLNIAFGKAALRHIEPIATGIRALREGKLSRAQAYDYFNALLGPLEKPGMGPSCFTKLIRFCCPKRRGYIMDYWTSRSINLLFESMDGRGRPPVLFNGIQVSPRNSGEDYERFCGLVETLETRMDGVDAIEIERRLLSSGSRCGKKRGDWRQYLIDQERAQARATCMISTHRKATCSGRRYPPAR